MKYESATWQKCYINIRIRLDNEKNGSIKFRDQRYKSGKNSQKYRYIHVLRSTGIFGYIVQEMLRERYKSAKAAVSSIDRPLYMKGFRVKSW